MHIDLDEESSIALEEDSSVPEPVIDAGVLVDDADDVENDDVEYEYVPVSEVTEGFAGKVKDVVVEHFVPIVCAVIVVLCLLIMTLGRHVNSILIAVGFVVIMIIFAIALYAAWKDRKETRDRYEYAKRVQDSVREKVMADLEEEGK